MGLLGMACDWASERLNAEGLLRFLADEYFEEDELRRSVLKNWPESPHSRNAGPALKSGRFMPELYIRDDNDDSFRFLQSYVRRTVMELLHACKEQKPEHHDQKEVPQVERQSAYDAEQPAGVADAVAEGHQPVENGQCEILEAVHETGEDPVHLAFNGQTEVVEALGEMSDAGVIGAIPSLLDKMERKALLSIYAVVSGKTDYIRNRASLVHRVKTFFDKLSSEQRGRFLPLPLPPTLQEVVNILRSPKSYKKVEANKIKLDTSSSVFAARSALSQVDSLPLKDIRVIYQTLAARQADEVGQLKAGANKEKLKARILKSFDEFKLRAGDRLPKSVRKCLIVMSLSARHALGNDWNLSELFGPIPPEKQSLHQSILSALSDLSHLKKENLLLLYKDLVPDSDVSSKTGVTVIRNQITSIFLDCLLSSEIRRVPEYVQTAASKVKVMMSDQQPKRRGVKDQRKRKQEEHEAVGRKRKRLTEKKDPKKRKRAEAEETTAKPKPPLEKSILKRSIRLELEGVLRVSSHLQQIMYELSECSNDGAFPSADGNCTSRGGKHTGRVGSGQTKPSSPSVAESGVAVVRSREVVEKSVYRSDHNTEALMRKRIQVWSVDEFAFDEEGAENPMEERESCKDGSLSQDEAKWMQDVTQVGDRAAAVAYMLVGCAVEEMSRLRGQKLESPLRDYLRSGVKRRPDDTDMEVDKACWDQDQVAFILDLAQNDPRISRSVLSRQESTHSLPSRLSERGRAEVWCIRTVSGGISSTFQPVFKEKLPLCILQECEEDFPEVWWSNRASVCWW